MPVKTNNVGGGGFEYETYRVKSQTPPDFTVYFYTTDVTLPNGT